MKRALNLGICLVMLAGMAAAAEPSSHDSLPIGTAVKMKLETRISTTTSQAGDRFAGRVVEPVTLKGRTVIPVGASVKGHVVSVSEPRRVRGVPTIHLVPDEVTMPNGERYALSAVVVDATGAGNKTDVDEEGRIKGSGTTRGDKIEMAAGTGGGALVGALAGGGKGMLIGGAIGATVTVAHWMTKRHSTDLPAGTEIVMELSREMELRGTE